MPDHGRESNVASGEGRFETEILQDALRAIRLHLGMDVAFVAEFRDDSRVFRIIDSDGDLPVGPGDVTALKDTYCQRAVDGRIPLLIADTSLVPEVMALPVTNAMGIGSYLTAPIRLSNGSIYGTLCCVGHKANPALGQRDLDMLNLFGEFVGRHIERAELVGARQDEIVARIMAMIEAEAFSVVLQPILDIRSRQIKGFEALTRFSSVPIRSPDVWFREASEVGLGRMLEMAAICRAIAEFAKLPTDVFLSLNVSPDHIRDGAISALLADAPVDRLVLEITEHTNISDYAQLSAMLLPLRNRGMRLAIDDAGAGFSSFRHILNLKPDIIKLDLSITRDIDSNTSQRALAAALIRFAEETGSKVVAEGVETEAEFEVLRKLRVHKMQGYLIGRPVPVLGAIAMLADRVAHRSGSA
jgi:EAL domain-containing protein (putative c-di-GMP-specific phosphodiesterase class I)